MNLNKRFMCYSVSFVILLKCIFIISATSPKSYPITTLLNAKWLQTPLYLEISEYLSDENSNLFWEYVDKIYDADIPLNQIDIESKSYITSINYAKSLLGSMQISILKLAVSMHTLTPRVQLHLQLANETFKNADNSKCDSNRNPSSLPSTFLLVPPNNIICDIDSFNVNNKRDTEEKENTILDFAFDHIYPGSENNSYPVILYSDIGSFEFRAFHKILKKMAINGEIRYILRHNIKNIPNRKVRLSGYGVELHLKSTEYKSQDDSKKPIDAEARPPKTDDIEMEVDGFDFNVLKTRYPDLSHSLDRFLENLIQKSEEIEPLKAWEFQDLGLQAAQRVSSINGEESLQILQFTVQNFPTQAKFLLTQSVSEDLRKEMKHNTEIFGRTLNLQPPDAAIFINGLYFDTDTLDLTVLLETLRTELTVLTGLFNNNIQGKFASSLLTLDLSPSSSKEFAIDIRDTAILWINDIENDPQYKRWPSSIMDLLRPTFPGMLRNVRKNLFNLVLIVDPLVVENRGLVKLAESFIIHLAPIRLGLVFDTRKQTEKTESDYRALFCAFNYISQKQNPRAALGFLTDVFASASKHKNVKYDDIRIEFKKSNQKLKNNEINGILGEDSDYDYGQQLAAEFIERLGFKNSPQALLNGVPIQQNLVNVDDLEEAVFTDIIQQTPNLQKSVYRGDLSDTDSVIDFLMDQPHVMPRLNQRILYTDDQKLLDITGSVHHLENINELLKLSKRDMIATALENLKYFTSKNSGEKMIDGKRLYFTTLWIIADLEDSKGRTIFINSLKHMKSSGQTRIAFIPNCNHSSDKSDSSSNNNNGKSYNLNKLIWAASQVLPETENNINLILKWLKNSENILDDDIPEQIKDFLSETDLHMKVLKVFAQRIFNVKESEIVVVNNGKIIGPLLKDEIFTVDDFGLMERYNNYQYADKLRDVLKLHKDTEGYHVTSDTIFKLITILLSRQQTKNRFTIPNDLQDNHSVIKLPPKDKSLPFFDITAILDPASKPAQKITPILVLLRNVVNCNMKVYLCAVEHHSDMPVKNFYRFVIEPEIQFKPDGKLSSGPYAKFTGLPTTPLLTQNLQVPENWLVEVVRSVYDLDNIKLIDIGGPVHSEYELEYLLLEGHCFDSMTGSPPRGLQITLGTKDNPTMVDTIVMANLGYFQLKANPNIWELRLRQGRSSDIYDIISVEGLHTIQHNNSIKVVISSLRSHVIKLRVSKKSDKLNIDLLSDDDTDDNSIWSSITSSFTSSSNNKETDILNIFSLASGHLYERLLRIMMLSVLKQTKTPVKFWFLKNYLSPQFTDFLPHMATEYGFQYELVQYKWPRWLHQQTEKQRTIWGYKILFLDVLFPLDVKKIIFVDADAIVRTDLTELNKMDLNGAPYAYTPFCDSRKEMEGFRFWKQGYWRNHLMGRKYHISALYVVDLKKFRKIAAGDRLRGQYQALSQDPNSLSNLDQDLPNNMIHQVPIKSLPEEWLWCETWCNDDSLKKAKVIDLCNNPMTKEAKLTAAQRIVPEWKKYDNEIKELVAKIEDHEMDQNQLSIDDKEKLEKLGEFVHSEL